MSRHSPIRYAARIWREDKPDLTVSSRDLGYLRQYATKKLRQHLSKRMEILLAQVDAGLVDPLSISLAAECTIVQEAWGAAIRYRGRLVNDGWGASYHIVVD